MPRRSSRPSLLQRLLIAGVQAYRYALSPWLGSACRFEPTCSAYALEALRRHGAGTGGRLTVGRLLRCHPWCAGGVDAVPADAPPPLFTSLLDRARRPAPLAPSTGGHVPSRKNPP